MASFSVSEPCAVADVALSPAFEQETVSQPDTRTETYVAANAPTSFEVVVDGQVLMSSALLDISETFFEANPYTGTFHGPETDVVAPTATEAGTINDRPLPPPSNGYLIALDPCSLHSKPDVPTTPAGGFPDAAWLTTLTAECGSRHLDFHEQLSDLNLLPKRHALYVDIQILESDQGLIIKEFSATCFGTHVTAWALIKSPAGASPTADNKHHLLHGISWSDGFCDEQTLCSYMKVLARGRNVIVKAGCTKNVLESRLHIHPKSIVVAEQFPAMSDLRRAYFAPQCPFHKQWPGYSEMWCSYKNARVLKEHDANIKFARMERIVRRLLESKPARKPALKRLRM